MARLAKKIIGEIIKSHIDKHNYSHREISLLSGINEVNLSNLINGKKAISFKQSEKLSKVFDDLKDDETFLFKMHSKLNNLESNNEVELEIANSFKDFKLLYNFKLLDDFSKINIVRKNIDGASFENFEKFILNSSLSFSKYKDKALAKFWIVLMYKKHKNNSNPNTFKKSSKSTVYKMILDIFFSNLNIDERVLKIKQALWDRGIMVANGPYISKSLVKGVSFKKKNTRFIFLSDMYKREYRWLIFLVHELVHFYENITDEDRIEEHSITIIKSYLKKYIVKHQDFAVFFKFYDSNSQTFLHDDKNKYFDELYDQTKEKIDFGSPEELLQTIDY